MPNNALIILDDLASLDQVIDWGAYSPRFNQPEDDRVRWRLGHRKATADLACLQPGGYVYLFAKRGIHGIGILADPPVTLNHVGAFADDPGTGEGILPGTSLPQHRFVVRLDADMSHWFETPVDMDDVLTAGGSRMYALRTMEDRSFAIFDEEEQQAFEQELRLRNVDGGHRLGGTPPDSEPLSVTQLNRAIGADDELAIESDLAWRLNRGEDLPAFDGTWSSSLRQVTASPPKPVSYIDRIDLLARRFEGSGRFVREHAVIELKKGKATKKDAEQLMRYVDWVVTEYHHGQYGRVRAYLVAEEFGPHLESGLEKVALRLFTVDPRRPRARHWEAFSLVRAVRGGDGSYAYDRVFNLAG
jgi:hypothetical protein